MVTGGPAAEFPDRVGFPADLAGGLPPGLGPLERVAVDSPSPERGLAGLVLTIVELLRQLMERQALRRLEYGDLSEEQVERLGSTLLALEQQMAALREHFGLTAEDLNLDLGPLGPLLPRDEHPLP